MAQVSNPTLTVATDRPIDQAALTVACDVDFTDFEVNEMNILGLRYELQCRVVDRDMLDDQPVATFTPILLPRIAGGAVARDHIVFTELDAMDQLHGPRLLGKDRLIAEVTLRNQETSESKTARSDMLQVDLTTPAR
jgi:hypothetical protein